MKVSVSMITYNHERFIEQSLASVLEQDLKDLEIVVSDDCSTDGTWDLLCQMRDEAPDRIRLFRTSSNTGGGENFLQSVAECRGEYVAFLEGDDFWTDREKLSRQVRLLDADPGLSSCFHTTRSIHNGLAADEFVIPALPPAGPVDIDFLAQPTNPVALGSLLARRSALLDLREWLGGLRLGDWALCFMLAQRGSVGFIPREMSRYRIHPGGGWSTMPPHLQVVFILHMLLRVARLTREADRGRVTELVQELAGWLGHDLIVGEVPVQRLLAETRSLADPDLNALLLSHLLQCARSVAQSRAWLEGQVQSLSSAFAGSQEQITVWQGAADWHRGQSEAWEAEARRHDKRARALEASHQ